MKHTHRFLCFLLLLAGICNQILAKGVPEYTLEGAGSATQGCYLVKTTVITKNKKIDDADIVRAAIHGALFRGFSDPISRVTQKPIVGSAANEAQHIDFYNEFFGDAGSATNFATEVTGSRTIVKSDGKYRITAIVNIRKDALKKYLEDAGIIKGLNSIF